MYSRTTDLKKIMPDFEFTEKFVKGFPDHKFSEVVSQYLFCHHFFTFDDPKPLLTIQNHF